MIEPTPAGEVLTGIYATYLVIKYGPKVVDLTVDMFAKEHTKNRSKSNWNKHTKTRSGGKYGKARNAKRGNKNKKFMPENNPNIKPK